MNTILHYIIVSDTIHMKNMVPYRILHDKYFHRTRWQKGADG